MTLLLDILNVKGRTVWSIDSKATLADVVQKLNENRCGALVVCDGEQMVGIISERDILRTLADTHKRLEEIPVQSCMTSDVITAAPDNNINEIMGLMTNRRVRHLPVLEEGKLAGMISIGDVVKAQHDELSMENHYLKSYIQS